MIEIPEPTVASHIEAAPETAALLVVDMQNDFVDPGGALCVAAAAATVPAIARLRDFARARGMLIVYTQDWHTAGSAALRQIAFLYRGTLVRSDGVSGRAA